MDNLPCENCLLVPACRNKRFMILFAECSLIKEYLPHFDKVAARNYYRMNLLETSLKPTQWRYGPKFSNFHQKCPLIEEIRSDGDNSASCNMLSKKGASINEIS